MTQLVDWDLAVSTARTLGRSGPAVSPADAASAVAGLRATAAEAVEQVSDYTGLRPDSPPPVRVVDRGDWARANVNGLKSVLDPLAEKLSRDRGRIARTVGAWIAGTQAGVVLGYLSGKVLGQFEVFGENNGRLLLVAPNIVDTERQLKADSRDFRLWVCLHEAAHAAQFGAVEWLRPHFLSEIDEFASSGDSDGTTGEPGALPQFAQQARRAVELLADSVRDGDTRSILDLVTSPHQRAVVDRLTAIMTLLEGHADFVMDRVAEDLITDVAALRRGFDRRRLSGGPVQRVVRKLLGVDVKLQQYVRGKKFVEQVVDSAGMDTFNRVWERAEHLPTLSEIESPRLWLERVAA